MVFIKGNSIAKKILWLQWIAAIGVFLVSVIGGLMFGWTSPYLAQLTNEDSIIPLNKDEASWIASFLNAGRLLGSIFGGVGVEFFGTRRTLVATGFPLILAWICIIVADSVLWLYSARIFSGIGVGMTFSSFPLFLGEIADPAIRGSMVSLGISGFAFGTAIGNTMGAYLPMALFSYISLVPNVISIILFIWLPDSPHYLIRLNRIEDAEKSIVRYNPNVDPKSEIEILKEFFRSSQLLTFKDRLRELNLPQNRRALLITAVLYFFMQACGVNTLVYYLQIVLTNAKVTIIPPPTVVIIVGFITIVAGWISIYVADKFRRKILLIFSSVGVGLSMLAFGIHFTLLEKGFDSTALQWLPISATIAFVIFMTNGLVGVPNMILSELFAANIKSLAATFASVWCALVAFAAAKSYQPLVDLIKDAWVFYIHAIIMVFAVIFGLVWMPETKGKSLKQIQDDLCRK